MGRGGRDVSELRAHALVEKARATRDAPRTLATAVNIRVRGQALAEYESEQGTKKQVSYSYVQCQDHGDPATRRSSASSDLSV
jgi:hypothetical protein